MREGVALSEWPLEIPVGMELADISRGGCYYRENIPGTRELCVWVWDKDPACGEGAEPGDIPVYYYSEEGIPEMLEVMILPAGSAEKAEADAARLRECLKHSGLLLTLV